MFRYLAGLALLTIAIFVGSYFVMESERKSKKDAFDRELKIIEVIPCENSTECDSIRTKLLLEYGSGQ